MTEELLQILEVNCIIFLNIVFCFLVKFAILENISFMSQILKTVFSTDPFCKFFKKGLRIGWVKTSWNNTDNNHFDKNNKYQNFWLNLRY